MATPKIHYRIPPCADHDIPAMQNWLEDMAARGLHLASDGIFLGLGHFEEGPPKKERFRLEATTTNGGLLSHEYAPEENIQALCAQMGWTYRARRGQFHIWSCDDPNAPELHTDPQIQAISVAALGKHLRKKLAGNLFFAIFYLFALYGDILLSASITYGSWWVETALGLFTWGLIRQVMIIRQLARWRKGLQNGAPLPQRQPRSALYFCGKAIETLAFAAVILNLIAGSMNILAKTDQRTMEQSDTFPFATIADLYPGCELERKQGMLKSNFTLWSDFISPVNYDASEYAQVTLDGKAFDVYLTVNYHELRWEWAAERLAREMSSQAGANLYDQALAKLFGSEPVTVTPISLPGADYCAYYYSNLPDPYLILRSGNVLLRIRCAPQGQAPRIPPEELAMLFLERIQ